MKLTILLLIVCAIQRTYNESDDGGQKAVVRKVVPIAGALQDHGAFAFDYEAARLKTSDSNSDSRQEGLRLILKGGAYPLDVPHKEQTRQRAVIEFICDPEKEGNEGEWESDDKYDEEGGQDEEGKTRRKRDDGEKQLMKDGAALKFISYGKETDSDWETLRLEWRTSYACESGYDQGSASWGLFTWLVVMLVLSPLLSPSSYRFPSNSVRLRANYGSWQRIHGHCGLPHLRLVAQLQQVRSPRLGPRSPRRCHPRHPLPHEGLDSERSQHRAGVRQQRRIQRCLEELRAEGNKPQKYVSFGTCKGKKENNI